MSIHKNADPRRKGRKCPFTELRLHIPAPARGRHRADNGSPVPADKEVNNKKNLQKTIISYIIFP